MTKEADHMGQAFCGVCTNCGFKITENIGVGFMFPIVYGEVRKRALKSCRCPCYNPLYNASKCGTIRAWLWGHKHKENRMEKAGFPEYRGMPL